MLCQICIKLKVFYALFFCFHGICECYAMFCNTPGNFPRYPPQIATLSCSISNSVPSRAKQTLAPRGNMALRSFRGNRWDSCGCRRAEKLYDHVPSKGRRGSQPTTHYLLSEVRDTKWQKNPDSSLDQQLNVLWFSECNLSFGR